MSLTVPRTIVHQLHQMAEQLKDGPALWTRRGGEWVPTSWRQYAQRVRDFSLGLQTLGFKEGQSLAVMSFNREEWLIAALGAMAAGGTAVGLYTTSSPEQLKYVIEHSGASVVLVEHERFRAIVDGLALKGVTVVVIEPPPTPIEGVMTFPEVLELGARANESDYYARVEALQPEAVAQLIYTSGTTGNPKGVMLSHHNLCWTAVQLSTCHPTTPEDMLLSYLPLSHIAEQVCSIYGPLMNGMQVSFARSFDALGDDLREVRPTLFFAVPRVWEKMKAKIEGALAEQPRVRRRVIRWARDVAARLHEDERANRQSSITLHAQLEVARRTVFAALKAKLGLDRAHVLATSAAPISIDVLEFFASLDLPIAETYGQSEVTGPTSVSLMRTMKFGKLGRPIPGVEVKIADDGEVLVRGGNVCLGYFKDEKATAELLAGGWLHSGDLGVLDGDGYLQVTGRKKELIVTSGGKKTSPSNLEALLKDVEPIGNAVVLGDGHNHLVALLTLDADRAKTLARHKGWPSEVGALRTHAGFLQYLGEAIETQVNSRIARFETIKRFEVLEHDFSIEGGELTSTLKVKRRVVEAKYAKQIAALYA